MNGGFQRSVWRYLCSLAAFTLLSVNVAHSESLFDELFDKNGSYQLPSNIQMLEGMINNKICQEADPPVDPSVTDPSGKKINFMNAVLIPKGRSLQKSEANYTNPRIVFSSTGAAEVGTPPNLSISNNPSSSRLFIGYSPGARTLEIISWDPAAGQYDFFLAQNYPKGPNGEPPQVIQNPRVQCMQCHQDGGPLLSRAPWDETNSSPAMTRKLCEQHPSGTYLGVTFATDCKCTKTSKGTEKCNPPNVNSPGLSAVSELDQSVREGSGLQQSRIACKSMCGTGSSASTLSCRKMLLESALRYPRPSQFIEGFRRTTLTSIAKIPLLPNGAPDFSNETRGPAPSFQAMVQASLSSKTEIIGGDAGRPATESAAAATQSQMSTLQALLSNTWPTNGFSYKSSVLADRNPATSPPTYFNAADSNGNLDFSIGPTNGNLADYGLSPVISATGRIPPGGDPAMSRPRADGIPKENAALYAMDVAFTCLGFDEKDAEKITSCANKTPGGVEGLIQSDAMQSVLNHLAKTWPLSGPGSTKPSDAIQSAILGATCKKNVEPGECPFLNETLTPVAQNSLTSATQAVNAGPGCDPSQISKDMNSDYTKNIKPIFQQKCMFCHDTGAKEPWYARIPPASMDISNGESHLNLSGGFPFSSSLTSSEGALLGEIRDEASQGTMPPKIYDLGHPIMSGHPGSPAYLTNAEKKTILAWADRWKNQLACYDLAKSNARKPASSAIQSSAGSASSAQRALSRCIECHKPGGNSPNFMGKSGADLTMFKGNPSLLREMITRMQSQGADHMPKGDFDPTQTAKDADTLNAWIQNGEPLN